MLSKKNIAFLIRAIAFIIIIVGSILLLINMYEMYQSYTLCGTVCFLSKNQHVNSIRFVIDFLLGLSYVTISIGIYKFVERARVIFIYLIFADFIISLIEYFFIGDIPIHILLSDLLLSGIVLLFFTRRIVKSIFLKREQ